MLYDIHTHSLASHSQLRAIYNLRQEEILLGQLPHTDNTYFSCGMHPWHLADSQVALLHLCALLTSGRVVAIGEAGLDTLQGADMAQQEAVFVEQIKLAKEFDLPMIIHCVKAWSAIRRLYKEYKPSKPWIIHGFRRGAEHARQLLDEGFYLSLGQHYNKEALSIIYPNQLFFETDDATINIEEVYRKAASDLSCDMDELTKIIEQNVSCVFNLTRI